MYGKLFKSMYDGTLVEDWRALITFQQMIVLCDADGVIDITPHALSRQTGIPIEHIKSGIEILQSVDKYSRTPNDDGRRIMLIDDHRPWGWYIVNHSKYKHLQDADTVRSQTRERVRKHREKKRSVTDGNAQKRHIDTNTDTDTKINTSCKNKFSPVVPYEEIINKYHTRMPHNPQVIKLTANRKKQIKARHLHELEQDIAEWDVFFGYCAESKFLTGRAEAGHNRSKPFIASIDFLINESNMIKIAEGKYHE